MADDPHPFKEFGVTVGDELFFSVQYAGYPAGTRLRLVETVDSQTGIREFRLMPKVREAWLRARYAKRMTPKPASLEKPAASAAPEG